MAERILMVAYHFPPCGEVSGTLRTLAMARSLREQGWDPFVLAPRLASYPVLDHTLADPEEFASRLHRAFAFDAKRHLGVAGHYPEWLAQPDRWGSWCLDGVRLGLKLIRRYRPKALWSTYPIATTHRIAVQLKCHSQLPWIADFRDPMLLNLSDLGRRTRASRVRLDRRCAELADACVFTTRSALVDYRQRYADVAHGLFEVIPNGFDEDIARAQMSALRDSCGRRGGRPFTLVHSGALYDQGRSPEPLFRALNVLKRRGEISPDSLQVVFRGIGTEEVRACYATMSARYHVDDLVELMPSLDREAALHEQFEADGLLLLQESQFNLQIPAKFYEYLRIGKPILALTDPVGETARLFADERIGFVADIGDPEQTARRLLEFLRAGKAGRFSPLEGAELSGYARSEGGRQLVKLLERTLRAS